MTTQNPQPNGAKKTAPVNKSGSTRAVANPNSSGSKGFWWALAALLLIGALVIGLIVYNGRGAQADRVAENSESVEGVEMDFSDNTITLKPAEGEAEKAASIFEDFSCSYCAKLSKETDAEMLENIRAGKLEIDIHPLVFQDGYEETYTPGHATTSLAATLALAEHGELQAYWNLRKVLMEQQQQVYNSVDANDLADMARDFGASKEAIEDIRNEKFKEMALEVGDANAQYLIDETGQLSSPRVLVDGKDVESNPLSNWMDDLLG